MRNQRGITLVALVVTIVVLIILATISISIIFDNGIMDRARDTKDYQANADAQWEATNANVLAYIDEAIKTSN